MIFSATLGYALTPEDQRPENPPSWVDSPEILSIATGLTGLVGGVVAVALGQQQQGGNESSGGTQEASTRQDGWFRRKLRSLLTVEGGKSFLAVAYAVVYTVLGLGAAAVWIFTVYREAQPPDTMKALASVALGLFIPIVRTYFIPGDITGN